MPACIIAGLLFVPFFWRSGVYTIPEFLGRRYNTIVQRASALLWLGFLAINLGIMMHASAVILGSFIGFDYYLSVWGTGLVVGFYTVSGGLAAVVMTDALQMIVIFIVPRPYWRSDYGRLAAGRACNSSWPLKGPPRRASHGSSVAARHGDGFALDGGGPESGVAAIDIVLRQQSGDRAAQSGGEKRMGRDGGYDLGRSDEGLHSDLDLCSGPESREHFIPIWVLTPIVRFRR